MTKIIILLTVLLLIVSCGQEEYQSYNPNNTQTTLRYRGVSEPVVKRISKSLDIANLLFKKEKHIFLIDCEEKKCTIQFQFLTNMTTEALTLQGQLAVLWYELKNQMKGYKFEFNFKNAKGVDKFDTNLFTQKYSWIEPADHELSFVEIVEKLVGMNHFISKATRQTRAKRWKMVRLNSIPSFYGWYANGYSILKVKNLSDRTKELFGSEKAALTARQILIMANNDLDVDRNLSLFQFIEACMGGISAYLEERMLPTVANWYNWEKQTGLNFDLSENFDVKDAWRRHLSLMSCLGSPVKQTDCYYRYAKRPYRNAARMELHEFKESLKDSKMKWHWNNTEFGTFKAFEGKKSRMLKIPAKVPTECDGVKYEAKLDFIWVKKTRRSSWWLYEGDAMLLAEVQQKLDALPKDIQNNFQILSILDAEGNPPSETCWNLKSGQ